MLWLLVVYDVGAGNGAGITGISAGFYFFYLPFDPLRLLGNTYSSLLAAVDIYDLSYLLIKSIDSSVCSIPLRFYVSVFIYY